MDGAKGQVQLPDELLLSIMGGVETTVSVASKLTHISEPDIQKARNIFVENSLLRSIEEGNYTTSIIGVDGGRSIERLAEMDLMLVQAAGIEGLGETSTADHWDEQGHQYLSWQAALPHGESNEQLSRGIMSLMELMILNNSNHRIRILDGSHLTSVLGVKQLVGAAGGAVDKRYIDILEQFLMKNKKTISDIPSIIKESLSNSNIIASTKYNSSRQLVEHFLHELNLSLDDKSMCSKILLEGEYTTPLPIGIGERSDELFDRLHIKYRLPTDQIDIDTFDWLINEALDPIKTRDIHGNRKKSEIYFTYFKPYNGCPVYRLEFKEEIAKDLDRLEYVLRSIKQQVVFPGIIEPYPQYLADAIAKSVSSGMRAIKAAVMISTEMGDGADITSALRGYRT